MEEFCYEPEVFWQVQKIPGEKFRKRYIISKKEVTGDEIMSKRGISRILYNFYNGVFGNQIHVPYPYPEIWIADEIEMEIVWSDWVIFEIE